MGQQVTASQALIDFASELQPLVDHLLAHQQFSSAGLIQYVQGAARDKSHFIATSSIRDTSKAKEDKQNG